MPGTLDRIATCGATQLMQPSARTADRVSEPAVIPADSVNSACRRNIRESRGVTWPPVAAATLVSDEADHLCRGAKRSRGEPTLATRAGVVKVIAFDTRNFRANRRESTRPEDAVVAAQPLCNQRQSSLAVGSLTSIGLVEFRNGS